MNIAAVLTLGYGPSGSASGVLSLGFNLQGSGTTPSSGPPTVITLGFGPPGSAPLILTLGYYQGNTVPGTFEDDPPVTFRKRVPTRRLGLARADKRIV